MKKIRESKEKLGNLRETGEKIKVGWVQGFGSFLKIRESCPLIRGFRGLGDMGGWRVEPPRFPLFDAKENNNGNGIMNRRPLKGNLQESPRRTLKRTRQKQLRQRVRVCRRKHT